MTTYTDALQIPYLDQNVAQPEIPENEFKDIVDAAVAGNITISMTADTTYVLGEGDTTLAYPREWQYGILKVNGTHTAATELHLPDGYKGNFIVNNNTGYGLEFKNVSQTTGVTIPTTAIYNVYSDGTDIRRVT